MRSAREMLEDITFRLGKWWFFVVVLALLPIGLGGLSTVTRQGHSLRFDALFDHGELLVVSAAVVGAALAELFSQHDQRFRTLRLFAGCSAGVVVISSSMWFADIAAGLRDGSRLDDHVIAVGSLAVFGLAIVTGLSCLIVATVCEDDE